MKVRYAPEARAHMAAIAGYIAERNPIAARRVLRRIRETIDRLRHFPQLGHVGRVPDTHEIVVPGLSYIVVYEVDHSRDQVVILGVFHGRQDRR